MIARRGIQSPGPAARDQYILEGMSNMADPARAPLERFTYGDYRRWPDDERWELIDGMAWSMSPAPKRRHQSLAGTIFSDLANFLRAKPCKVYISPFDVLLPDGEEPDDDVDSVVQPDVVVFCDRSKLTEAGARGAPDLVVEILSPSTSKKDQHEKLSLYERHGVREYWVVDPGNRSIRVLHLGLDRRFDQGELRAPLDDESPIASRVLDGFAVDPKELFASMD